MGFWGLGENGTTARNNYDEINRWNFDRGQNAYNRADEQYGYGDYFRDWLTDYWGGRANGTFGSPEDLTEMGRRVMPWLDDSLARRQGRIEQGRSNYDSIGPISDTIDSRRRRLDEFGGNIGRNFDALDTDINDYAGRAFGREENYTRDIIGNINNTMGGLYDEAGDVYGNAIRDVGPGSEARAARAGRAFAPQIASTILRLRQAGVDPTSPQAQSILANVERGRSRAIDDSLGDAFNQAIDLRLGRFNTQSGIRRDELDQVNREKLRNLGATEGIDRDVTGMRMDNRDLAFNRAQDWYLRSMDEDLMGRDLRERDVASRNQFLQAENDEEDYRNRQYLERYNQGVDSRGRDVDYQNQGADRVGGLMNNAYGQANWQDSFGSGRFDMGQAGFNNQYQREAANAGWGTKLLTGLGTTLAGAFLPTGGGPWGQLGNVFRGATGGGGGGQGPGGTPYFNPNLLQPQPGYGATFSSTTMTPRFRAGAPSMWSSLRNPQAEPRSN